MDYKAELGALYSDVTDCHHAWLKACYEFNINPLELTNLKKKKAHEAWQDAYKRFEDYIVVNKDGLKGSGLK